MSDLHCYGEEEQGGVYPNMVSISPASESLSMIGTDHAADTSDPDAHQTEEPPPNPMTTYGHPHQPEVSYDKLHLCQSSQLAAPRMYNKQYCAPIALLCMFLHVFTQMLWRMMNVSRKHLHLGRGVCLQRFRWFRQTNHQGRNISRRNCCIVLLLPIHLAPVCHSMLTIASRL